MAMIPTYQDMLAQALQQSQQQQQAQQRAQQQGTQNRSIFDNPAFGNSLMKMGLTMLADSEQGYGLGESIGRGGLAFMQERQSQEELQRQAMVDQQKRQQQEALLARQQLQDNLSLLDQKRQAMQYDAAAQQVQGLPQEYQGLGAIDPLSTVKLAATNAFNRQDAEREFAQKVQLQNMQAGNQRALAQEQAGNQLYLEQLRGSNALEAKRLEEEKKAKPALLKQKNILEADLTQTNAGLSSVNDFLNKYYPTDKKTGVTTVAPEIEAITGPLDSLTPTFGQKNADAEQAIEQLKGLGFVTATGGIDLKGVTAPETEQMSRALANLSLRQGPEQLAKNVQTIKNILEIAKQRQSQYLNDVTGGDAAPLVTPEQARAELLRRQKNRGQ